MHGELGVLLELPQQRQPAVGGDHDLKGAGLAVPKGVFARVVDIEAVVGVLHHRHPQPLQTQHRNQPLHQRGFAGAGVAGKTHHIHVQYLWM